MDWHTGPMISFDIESTGTDPTSDRIVTASLVALDPSTGQQTRQNWLVDPGCDIPEQATAVHGITTDYAREHGQDPATVVEVIAASVDDAWSDGTPLVIYNAPYDLTMLTAEMHRHGMDPFVTIGPVLDPLVIDRAWDRYRKGRRTLSAVAEYHGIAVDDADAHTAAGDALTAWRVLWKQTRTYPQLADMSLNDLTTHQAAWHADWAENFEQFLKRTKRRDGEAQDVIDAVSVDPAWPARDISSPN
ncbi:DNA polymerase-3 subunit epsilon [Saccharopolyspora lacisalsi]|uniref:DNA polymerase-3 subunit epsilon n=1 Tax=Halosaccharopolyspora lacisalsi TaxID=1000566 RepID=A0A839E1Y6_9PSEU|nr:3'-5' exonuclease [Halosaccharopolyspora lacisalsi]MBA8827864.1 DNA polymerase-3 subunit epsilon [Halosaccharopolyspora lacisalsi]